METAPRLDRRADDDEFGTALRRDTRDLLAETSGTRADDLAPHRDAVGARDRGRTLESLLQARERAVHVRVDRQLTVDDQRADEDDARATVGGEPTGEIEGVLRLVLVEQRHDDAPVGDRARPPREMLRAVVQQTDVRKPHFRSWYGTEARITFGSKSRRRLR